MKTVMERYPYLVAEENSVVIGYAYAHQFVGRAAYDRCCELTIYLDKTATKKGVGHRLYSTLEECLKAMGVLNLYACIGIVSPADEYLTSNSADFHAHEGFRQVGYFTKCGRKFDRWYDMIWMEKMIGDHTDNPQELVTFSSMRNA